MKKTPTIMDSVVGDTPDKEAKKAMDDRMSEPKSQDELEVEVLDKFTDRLADMDSARKEIEADWDVCDGQMEANTFYDENGTLQVNVPLEQDLVETACGRFSGKLNFKLEPV
jgi:beta-glucanase (GH16 family)